LVGVKAHYKIRECPRECAPKSVGSAGISRYR
jgi:hypothetical protein